MPEIPQDSVRGPIRAWIEKHAGGLGDNVLEVGSRMTSKESWWIDNRVLGSGKWTGVDMQPGHNVDIVADIESLPDEWAGRFSGALCCEVLEHVKRPWIAVRELRRVICAGGLCVFTVPSCFPLHGFPDDYWRISESGIRLLLEDAGFTSIETDKAGNVDFLLNDHGEHGGKPTHKRTTPMHTMAIARA